MAKITKSYSKLFEGISIKNDQVNKGAWTTEEDKKLAEVIKTHGAKKWKSISTMAGLNRCGKSCRLRWLNYLRPNIKRGNISDQEEDLILRLHKLLGNRWSLIAGRLPGRTDNEIKNYWNSHLSKKISTHKRNKQKGIKTSSVSPISSDQQNVESSVLLSSQKVNGIEKVIGEEETSNNNKNKNKNNNSTSSIVSEGSSDFDVDDFFDFSDEGPLNMEWMSRFLELD